MPEVLTEQRGAVRHVVLNRPEKRNAFDSGLVRATGEALRAAADDPEVHCVLVRGAGPVFSAGVDLGLLADLAERPDDLRTFRQACVEAFGLAETMEKPTVCAIQGACLGGALELALACDLRVATSEAVMGLPEVRIGLIPDLGGSSRLPALVGLGRAKELVMTGRVVGAEEAERIGLVNRVVATDALEAAAQALIDELLAGAPVAVGLAKRALDAAARPALAASLELEGALQERCARTADFAEGVGAAIERRPARFTGR